MRVMVAAALLLALPFLATAAPAGAVTPASQQGTISSEPAVTNLLTSLQQQLQTQPSVTLGQEDTAKLLISLAEQLLADNKDLRQELKAFRATTKETLQQHANEHRRTRRTLSDNTTLQRLEPVRQAVTPEDVLANNYGNPNHFATTAAEQWVFFQVTDDNAGTEINTGVLDIPQFAESRYLFHGYCLALASSSRCIDSNCLQTTHNNVAQVVYTWSTLKQAWLQTGPGASGPQTGPNVLTQRPIVANGVKSLAHFSPNGEQDMIVPAASTQDVQGAGFPTTQCGDVWLYAGSGQGYAKYQDCGWTTNGSHSVVAFKMKGEQYLISTSMVSRQYDANQQLVAEDYHGQVQSVFKWSFRKTDNADRAMPHGFFLTSKDTNADVGNNGANTFQEFHHLSGVVHAETFTINGVYYLAFSEHVTNAGCPTVERGSRPSCQTVALQSHLFYFAPNAANPRGDCPQPPGQKVTITPNVQPSTTEAVTAEPEETPTTEAITAEPEETPTTEAVTAEPEETPTTEAITAEPEETPATEAVTARPEEIPTPRPGCQHFAGEFLPLQALPTLGAKAMHYFSLQLTGETAHFLAVAEHRDDNYASVPSSIYRWNGVQFGLFQRIATNFAERFTSYRAGTRTFLVVTNRGCPDVPREEQQEEMGMTCNAPAARAQTLVFEPLEGRFVVVAETDEVGHLHTHETDLRGTSAAEAEIAFADHELWAAPVGVTTFSVPFLNNNGFREGERQYIILANNKPTIQTVIPAAKCPSADHAVCAHPASLFSVTAVVSDGFRTQIESLSRKVEANNLYLKDLDTQLTGGAAFVSAWRRDSGMDLRTYTGTTAEAFAIGDEQYLALGFEQAYLPRHTCLERYTTVGGEPTACNGTAIASEVHCDQLEACKSRPSVKRVISYDTETIIYKVGQARQGLNFRGDTVNLQAPRLVEVQRLPSMGVQDLHFFQLTDPSTQQAYEACINISSPDCVANMVRPAWQFLTVANARATCEWDYLLGQERTRDPARVVKLYSWNNKTMQFDPSSQLPQRCAVTALHDFEVDCQADTSIKLETPACGAYLALAEDCASDLAYAAPATGPTVTHRVSFHKWNSQRLAYEACQPYADPSDPRNLLESPCFQATDPQRAAGSVSPGDEHQFDFPDLLPSSLRVGVELQDNGTDYYPELQGSNIAALEFMVPRSQKSIFYKGTDPSSDQAMADADQEVKTLYHSNGRTHYELALLVAFNKANTPPQAFGLTAVHAKSPTCSAGHPTTPRRRAFHSIQRGPVTQGGRGVDSFERVGLDGVERSYAVFAEAMSRPGSGRASSLYVHDVCNEYSQFTVTEELRQRLVLGGSTGPVASDGTTLCPYSLQESHVEAWEAFYNFYHPVSPCRGRVANPKRVVDATIQVPFYNEPPPAQWLSARGTTAPRDKYVYPRLAGSATTVATHGFAPDDYQYLHDHRDDVMVHLQDFSTYFAQSVAVKRLCGSGGQIWLVFGHRGIDFATDESFQPLTGQVARQPERNRFYIWNDRFAVPANNKLECSAAGAEALIKDVGQAFAVLGCFEAQTFTSPINTGAAYGVTFFTQGDFLFLTYLNFADGRRNFIDPTVCADAATDPSGALHADTAGVVSPTLTLDLRQFGGLQCRFEGGSSSSTSTSSNAGISPEDVVGLETLKQTFVTLDTPQTITGFKTFAYGQTIFAGSVRVEQDLMTANLRTNGQVDGVDVSDLNAEVARTQLRLLQRVTELEARVCYAQAVADAVSLRQARTAFEVQLLTNNTMLSGKAETNSNGWAEYAGYWYRLQPAALSWAMAEEGCKLFSPEAHLASVHTEAENMFIYHQLAGSNPTIPVWLGGQMVFRISYNFVFNWTDGSAFDIETSFQPWQRNEPNNLDGSEACIQMGQENNNEPGLWNDATCDLERQSVCKMPRPAWLACPEQQKFSGLLGACVTQTATMAMACEAAVKETLCLPKDTMTAAGWATLEASFARFVTRRYPAALVSDIEFSLYTTDVLFVVRGEKAEDIDVHDFFDALVCANTTLEPEGTITLLKTIQWTTLHCALLDSVRQDQLRTALASEVSANEITAPNIEVIDVICDAEDSSAIVQLQLSTSSLFASEVTQCLDQRALWVRVYDSLLVVDAGFWGSSHLEFKQDRSVPYREGSGDGDGDGTQDGL